MHGETCSECERRHGYFDPDRHSLLRPVLLHPTHPLSGCLLRRAIGILLRVTVSYNSARLSRRDAPFAQPADAEVLTASGRHAEPRMTTF